jgi:hypothetical protein
MRMQESHARQLRQEWGEKACTHPAFDHLTRGGSHDGYVCMRCGQEFTPAQRDLLLTNRKTEMTDANKTTGLI